MLRLRSSFVWVKQTQFSSNLKVLRRKAMPHVRRTGLPPYAIWQITPRGQELIDWPKTGLRSTLLYIIRWYLHTNTYDHDRGGNWMQNISALFVWGQQTTIHMSNQLRYTKKKSFLFKTNPREINKCVNRSQNINTYMRSEIKSHALCRLLKSKTM